MSRKWAARKDLDTGKKKKNSVETQDGEDLREKTKERDFDQPTPIFS